MPAFVFAVNTTQSSFSVFTQNDIQVCDVRNSFYPETIVVHALWHSFSQAKSACVQVSWLHQTLRPKRFNDGAHQGKFIAFTEYKTLCYSAKIIYENFAFMCCPFIAFHIECGVNKGIQQTLGSIGLSRVPLRWPCPKFYPKNTLFQM